MKRAGVVVVFVASLVASSTGASGNERSVPPQILAPLPGAVRARAGPEPPSSVVLIAGILGARPAYGCGVIVGEAGATVTILTAAHDLGMRRLTFTTVDGERLQIERTAVIAGHDLALVTAARPRLRFDVARFAPDPRPGLRVSVWGPIEDEPFTYQDAVVREIDPRATGVPPGSFAIDCPACDHGDSGTGVFDGRGELVGIVVAGYSLGRRRLFVLAERFQPDATLAAAADGP